MRGPLPNNGILSAQTPIAKYRNIVKIALILLSLPANQALFSAFKAVCEQKNLKLRID
jgi:hypothetical protein